MPFGFMNRLRNGYGNIYTPHAGSMIIQVQRETGLANRTIVISERQVALVRVLGSRIGLGVAAVFLATWLLFAVQSVRVPLLSGRIAELERDNRRIDSLQVALSRMHGRYEQVRQMLAAGGSAAATTIAAARPDVPNDAPAPSNAVRSSNAPATPPVRDTTGSDAR
jgi:hypothetical protein